MAALWQRGSAVTSRHLQQALPGGRGPCSLSPLPCPWHLLPTPAAAALGYDSHWRPESERSEGQQPSSPTSSGSRPRRSAKQLPANGSSAGGSAVTPTGRATWAPQSPHRKRAAAADGGRSPKRARDGPMVSPFAAAAAAHEAQRPSLVVIVPSSPRAGATANFLRTASDGAWQHGAGTPLWQEGQLSGQHSLPGAAATPRALLSARSTESSTEAAVQAALRALAGGPAVAAAGAQPFEPMSPHGFGSGSAYQPPAYWHPALQALPAIWHMLPHHPLLQHLAAAERGGLQWDAPGPRQPSFSLWAQQTAAAELQQVVQQQQEQLLQQQLLQQQLMQQQQQQQQQLFSFGAGLGAGPAGGYPPAHVEGHPPFTAVPLAPPPQLAATRAVTPTLAGATSPASPCSGGQAWAAALQLQPASAVAASGAQDMPRSISFPPPSFLASSSPFAPAAFSPLPAAAGRASPLPAPSPFAAAEAAAAEPTAAAAEPTAAAPLGADPALGSLLDGLAPNDDLLSLFNSWRQDAPLVCL